MNLNPNMSNKEVANLIFLDYKSKKPFLNLDYANVTTTGLEASREFATGGQGAPQRIVFDHSRKGTLKIETQIATMKLFSMLSGAGITNTFEYAKRMILTADSDTLTIPSNVDFVVGSVSVFAEEDDCGVELAITVTTNDITLPTGSTGNYIVYGIVKTTTAQTIKFNSKTFPKAYIIHGETPWKTEDDEIVAMLLKYYKAVPQSQFELSFSNTGIINMSITLDLLANNENDIYDMSLMED